MASINEMTEVLGRKGAFHLLRRSTFGPDAAQVEQFSSLTPRQALELLLDDSETDPLPPIDPATAATWVDPEGQAFAGESNSEQNVLFNYFQAWHMDVMRKSPATLKERITWFFHTHLPARWSEILSSEAIYYQNCLYRFYAFGSFRDLFRKICVDNAMLRYLDGFSNRFYSPNENFAREMFELYSIGKGPQLEEGDYTNYTEDDIREATRVLTGWMIDETFSYIDEDTGLPAGKMIVSTIGTGPDAVDVAREHDTGVKTFSEKYASRTIEPSELVNGYATVEAAYGELDEMIGMIFEKEATARFIAEKLYRFFVYHFISEEVKQDIITPMAQTLLNTDYSIVETLKQLLMSQHFYDMDDAVKENDNVGALIKSPVDLFTGLFRFFNIQLPDRETETTEFYNDMSWVVNKLVEQGLNFYEPFEVAGYPAYHQIPGYNRNWITTYALAHRYQTGDLLMAPMDEGRDHGIYLDILDWVENSGQVADPSDSMNILDVLLEGFFPVVITQERYDFFLYTVFLDLPEEDKTYARGVWRQEWQAYENSGDGTTVRTQLQILVSKLIQTPEFQMY